MGRRPTIRAFRFPLYLILGTYMCVFVRGSGGAWTIWYNQHPNTKGDDESLSTIKGLGYTVCGESRPQMAECRVHNLGVTFTESNAKLIAPDNLFRPCTNRGLVCFNADQHWGSVCQDYEIRFFCPYIDDDDPSNRSADYGLVALAAGMSVLVPLLCVVILQCVRQFRVKRTQRARRLATREQLAGMRSEPVDPGTFIGPPTYESLFTDGSGFPQNTGTDTLIQRNNTDSSTVDLSQVNEGFSPDDSRSPGIYQISSGQVYSRQDSSDNTGPNAGNFRRFPGMHLSVEDMILLHGGEQRTPPPAYDDAMIIIGPIPPKYSDVQKDSSQQAF